MADVFGEVDEQLRADRLRAFLQRAVPAFILTAILTVLVVVAVWGVQAYQTAESSKASQAYSDALDSVTKGDAAKAYDQFGALGAKSGPYQALALMQQGGIRMDQNKPAEAAALFDKAAAATKSPMVGDMAVLKSVYATMDTAPLAQIDAKLQPLIKPERPYHALAREALAMAKLAAGQTSGAKADLVALSLLQDTPDSARQRAQAIISLIDSGTGKGLKALEEQAKTAAPIALQPPPGAAGPPQGAGQDGAAQAQPEAAQ